MIRKERSRLTITVNKTGSSFRAKIIASKRLPDGRPHNKISWYKKLCHFSYLSGAAFRDFCCLSLCVFQTLYVVIILFDWNNSVGRNRFPSTDKSWSNHFGRTNLAPQNSLSSQVPEVGQIIAIPSALAYPFPLLVSFRRTF
jgi:hypothetical protein